MKKLLKTIMLAMVLFVFASKVYAEIMPIRVGTYTLESGETKDIYGGQVKFDCATSECILTLDNVDINEYDDETDMRFGIYYDYAVTIKLIGKNTIASSPASTPDGVSYYGIGSNESIKIIGNGKLNFDVNNYEVFYGIYSDGGRVLIGEEANTNGPVLNVKSVSTSGVDTCFIYNAGDIYNSEINCDLDSGDVAVCISSDNTTDSIIKGSYIKAKLKATEALAIHYQNSDLIIENTDVLFKDEKNEGFAVAITIDRDLTIKSSRIVDVSDADDSYSIIPDSSGGEIKFIREDKKDFFYLATSKMDNPINTTYTLIDNKIVYHSDTSLDSVIQTDDFDMDNLKTTKYVVITTGISNKITSGNNQEVKLNEIDNYSFKTNHFRYLVKSVKLDDTELDEEDYELIKDGTVRLTDTGIDKLNALDLGKHSIKLDYYYGKSLTSNFKIVEELNPQTSDNIWAYISSLLVSIAFIAYYIVSVKNEN